MNTVALFQRIIVMRKDISEARTQKTLSVLLNRFRTRPQDEDALAPTTLARTLSKGRKEVLFYAVEGTALVTTLQDGPLIAVYVAVGEFDLENCDLRSQIELSGDIDFEGFVEQGVRADLDVAIDGYSAGQSGESRSHSTGSAACGRFSGEQSEFFSDLSVLAVVAPTDNGANESQIRELEFESPFRSDVATRRRLDNTPHVGNLESARQVGEGVLFWPERERNTDRYGMIELGEEPSESSQQVKLDVAELDGCKGSLAAEIVAVRTSPHVGDHFRHIFPTQPDVGEIVTLGMGTCFVQDDHKIGLKPDDGRQIDWLNPAALYRCHCQTVRLFFVPF